jgi:hypothetical protein
MTDSYQGRPLLRPVLTLRKEPARRPAPAGGKKEADIVANRLDAQRANLLSDVRALSASGVADNNFGGHFHAVAEMFDDSFAPSKTPRDLFTIGGGSLLRGPADDGYLIEMSLDALPRLEQRVETNTSVVVRCDISRVKTIRLRDKRDVLRGRTIQQLWDQAPKRENGRAFVVWFSPFQEPAARRSMVESIAALRDGRLLVPVSSRIVFREERGQLVPLLDRSARQDSLAISQREYRRDGRARAFVEIPSQEALQQIIGSSSVFRLEPIQDIVVTSPGEGEEPSALPSDISMQPIVGLVDGGCSARRYAAAEAWREHSLVGAAHADTRHGNQVASIVVHGHEWNGNLPLPELYCRLGVAPVLAKPDIRQAADRIIPYLDAVLGRHPDTRVWNLSWNERASCDPTYVSPLGHDLAILARKHNVLFVISAGNVSNTSGDTIAPPADCEAALVVGGRQFDRLGKPSDPCHESLPGYGPELQLVPQVTSFSPLRILGGSPSYGTSFPTGLVSALAAHTFENLVEPTPDLVRALVINSTDLPEYNQSLGWGTPCATHLPWTCAPGTVTLVFRAFIKPGIFYYWEDIPIPPQLVRNGKLFGHVSLTTVHRPLCNSEGGPSYIATRVAAAVQYKNARSAFQRLVGSTEIDNTPELTARAEEFKWQPLRRECRDFTKSGGLGFNGPAFRIYARAFGRNVSQFGYAVNDDIPEIETAIVVSFSDGSNTGQLFDSMVTSLGNFVESAVVDQEIEIES